MIKNIVNSKYFRTILFLLTFLLAILVSYVYLLAAPPTSPYSPGQTLNPSCNPGSANCTVSAPLTTTLSTSTAIGMGSYTLTFGTSTLFVDAANNLVGIGTTTPSSLLTVGATSSQQFLVNSSGAVTIVGGSINNTSIGGTTSSTAQFTSVTSTVLNVTATSSFLGDFAVGTSSSYPIYSAPGRIVTRNDTNVAWPGLILENLSRGDGAQLQLMLDRVTPTGVSRRWMLTNDSNTNGTNGNAPLFNIEAVDANVGVQSTPIALGWSGRVGISGLTDPQYPLDVNGSIHTTASLFVNSNVGIGTTTPSQPLHIIGAAGQGLRISNFQLVPRNDGAAILQSVFAGNSVFAVAPKTSGLSAFEFFGTDFQADSTNYERLEFTAQSGNSNKIFSNAAGTGTRRALSFFADSATFGAETGQLYLATNGNVGVGTTTPALPFHVATTTASAVARFTNGNGYCDINPTNTALVCTSDQSLKKDVVEVSSALDAITSLRGVNFRWNSESEDKPEHYGFIAQEVEKVLPALVSTDPSTGLKLVNYTGFAPVLVEAVKELAIKVKTAAVGAGYSIIDALKTVGVDIVNGIVKAKEFIADKITATKISTNRFEMKDSVTSDIYCIQIANGDWQKIKGNCADSAATNNFSNNITSSTAPISPLTSATSNTTSSTINVTQQATTTNLLSTSNGSSTSVISTAGIASSTTATSTQSVASTTAAIIFSPVSANSSVSSTLVATSTTP